MVNEVLQNSLYFGLVISIGSYLFGSWMKKKTGWALCNPLLISVIMTILVLSLLNIKYDTYYEGARYLGYFLTPATVCLAIPLYKQLELLRQNVTAVMGGIVAGVLASAGSILLMSLLFGLSHEHYVTLLPKSITTAIGMGVSEEAGGIVTLTVASILITGILGNIMGETIFKLFRIKNPIAKGLAMGTSAHAVGTAKALELGEIEGAMSSLAIAVAGLLTVVVVPLVAGII